LMLTIDKRLDDHESFNMVRIVVLFWIFFLV
jgi:hypothetical protein